MTRTEKIDYCLDRAAKAEVLGHKSVVSVCMSVALRLDTITDEAYRIEEDRREQERVEARRQNLR